MESTPDMVSPLKEINCLSREKYKLLKQMVRDLKKKVKRGYNMCKLPVEKWLPDFNSSLLYFYPVDRGVGNAASLQH
jgi:hypothetical protein